MAFEDTNLMALFDWVNNPTVVLVFCIVFGTGLASYVIRRVFVRVEDKVAATTTLFDDAVVAALQRPLTWLVWVLGVAWAAEIISAGTASGLEPYISPLRYIAVISLLTLFMTRLISELEAGMVADGADVTTASAISKLARVSVIITACLSVLQTLGVSISGILAFGGVGGIAVGFAARDLLANFFGALMLYLDRPFEVGDWIRSPDRNIEGTVVAIGWRLTEIRTFDARPLYVPNSVFATISLENPSRMSNRRIYETVGVRYADVAVLEVIVAEVHGMLKAHEEIDASRTLIVNFNAFGASSLDFFVYAFTKTTDWVRFHQIKQDVLLRIADIITRHGAEIAFPTQTLHIQAEPDATA